MSRTPYYATLPSDQIGRMICARVQQYYADTRVTTVLAKQQIAQSVYLDLGGSWAGWNGSPGPTNQMTRGGAQGEAALVRINHARNLARNQIAMITNAKFDRNPRAESDDYDPMQAAIAAKYALDHFTQEAQLELLRISRIESATVNGTGYTHYGWNTGKGRVYAVNPDTGFPEHTGTIEAENTLPWNVVCNPYKDWKQQIDVTLRLPQVNRWSFAAKYPKFAEQILDAPTNTIVPFFNGAQVSKVTDDIEVFVTYHLPVPIPGLERGRTIVCLNTGLVVEEGPLEYGRFPIVRTAESEIAESPYGYASFWEYLGVQELYDNLQSIVATNQSTFGAQNVAVRTGVDPRPVQVEGGLNVFVCNDPSNDVKPLQLTKSPSEIFPHMDSLVRNMERLSGQSQVDRGEAQGDRQSGSALALLSAQSIRNASPYQTSDVEALKDEAQIILRILRRRAKRKFPVTVADAGGGTPYERAISGQDLGGVDAVDIELANPLQQTTEGRVAILQTFAQLKIPLDAKSAMEVVKSGKLEPATNAATREGQRIRLENKMIGEGKTPRALITDDHIRHCRDHAITMSDAAREDPAARAAFMAHVEQEHYRIYFGTDPEQDRQIGTYRVKMMVLCGLQPPPPDPTMQPGAGAPPEGGAPPAGADGALAPPGPAAGPAAVLGPPPNMPRLPTNAGTGEQWTPATAGGTPS